MKRWALVLNEEQLRTMNDALELYMRVKLGQLEAIADEISSVTPSGGEVDKNDARYTFSRLKPVLLDQHQNGSFGIHHPLVDERARIAFDIRQVARHQLWSEQPEGLAYTVDAQEPRASSTTGCPLPTIARVPEE